MINNALEADEVNQVWADSRAHSWAHGWAQEDES